MKILFFCQMAIACASLTFGGIADAATYTSTLLLPLSGKYTSSSANGINNAGQIVGASAVPFIGGESSATIWNDSIAIELPRPNGALGNSSAVGVNNAGFVVGNANFPGITGAHAALWSGTKATDLGAFGGHMSFARRINDAGEAVGVFIGPAVESAFRWNGSAMIPLANLGGIASSARDINQSGQVVGYTTTKGEHRRATIWNGSTPTELAPLSLGDSEAVGINDFGLVVGQSSSAEYPWSRVTLWNGTTALTLENLVGKIGYAAAINNLGQVVGRSSILGGGGFERATIWSGSTVTDLNSFLDGSLVSAGWILTSASDINDSGSIVGNAVNAITGEQRGYILSAVPEPQIYALMLAGLGLIVGVARRRNKQQ
jgi:uncharacterized membrane protein